MNTPPARSADSLHSDAPVADSDASPASNATDVAAPAVRTAPAAPRNTRTEGLPNVVFFFTDDQRFPGVNALGNDQLITPNMDRLVADGVAFTRAYIMGSTHGAVCMPSRAMLHSGRTLYHVPMDLDGPQLLGQCLNQAGYRTFGTGKWHNQKVSYAKSFTDGAKIFYGGMSNHLEVPVFDFDPSGRYPEEQKYTGEKFSSELFSNAAIDFLRQYDDDAPLFMYLSYTAPHDPRMAPKEYADLYDPDDIVLPDNFMPEHPFDNGELRIRDEKLAPFPRTPEVVREHIAAYYAMISHLDFHVGRVVKELQQMGEADNTVFIFAGDNGLAVGQHGLMGKQNMYEHSIRVPLVIAGPGIPAAQTRHGQCYLLDIFPTVCDLLGLPIPDSVEGESLVPMLMGDTDEFRGTQFYAYKDVQRAITEQRYKLIEYYVGGERRTQLFDLHDDRWETQDLAEDPVYADDVERLRAALAEWQHRVDDPILDQ